MRFNNLVAGIVAVMLMQLGTDALAFENEPDGFRGIKWGTSFSTHGKEMVASRRTDDGSIKCYLRTGDKLSIGDAKLTSLEYCYWKDQFYRVILESKDVRGLIFAFRAKFNGDAVNCVTPNRGELHKSCYWSGEITDIFIECPLLVNPHCVVEFQSYQLAEKHRKDKIKTAEEGAAKDF
jgi:hypothetical protein